VQWVHPRTGLGYALTAGICARTSDADVVVEEFVAPFVTLATPRWTARPVVGVVGWFDVDLRGHRLRDVLRRWAVRRHRSLIAVSVDVAEAVAAVHPRAEIAVIGHGVMPAGPPTRPRSHDVVCAAPLHIGPKGLDLLLDAWARVASELPGRLVFTGSGPQEGALRARAQELGLHDRVLFAGAGGSAQAGAALGSARAAVVPSRYEASGVAALDALAVGTPVVAFDLPALREVVPPACGVLVPRSGAGDPVADVAGFARALWALHRDDERCARAARRGPEIARGHDWDTLAGMQADVYRATAGPVAPRWA
jgi:glycosyltransferase involved in cell wall biosynthesis